MEKIIIYGLGKEGMLQLPYLSKTFQVTGYSDRKPFAINGYIKPCDIPGESFDYLVVTSTKYYMEIKEELAVDYQIPQNKIVTVSEFFAKICNLENMAVRDTSITDDGIYPAFCHKAAECGYIFDTFRLNPVIRRVYEHVSPENGQLMADMINKHSVRYFSEKDWSGFIENDKSGMPQKEEYILGGLKLQIAPTTLRYVKVLQDMLDLYQMDHVHTIAEIGIGYAGQCRIVMSYLPDREYYLIDLPEVLELAEVYLSRFSIQGKVNYIDGTQEFADRQYDLVISNYAFSELGRAVQDFYLEHVINHSKAGYMIWNSLSFKGTGKGYSVEELLARIEGSFVMEEQPLTAEDNCLIVWNRDKADSGQVRD